MSGWAIGAGEEYDDPDYQDEVEANALYDLLEQSVVPLFYDRGRDDLPRAWIAKMKAAIGRLAPFFNTDRMVRSYFTKFYLPARSNAERLAADSFALARSLAEWKVGVLKGWSQVAVVSTELDGNGRKGLKVGSTLQVESVVHLGSLRPEDVRIELYSGRLDEQRRIVDGHPEPMQLESDVGGGSYRFRCTYTCTAAGSQGFGVRVYPCHPELAGPFEMGLMTWG